MKGNFKIIRAKDGRPLVARLVDAAEVFGDTRRSKLGEEQVVEIYDPNFDHTDVGRVITRYFASAIRTRHQAYNLSLGGQIESDLIDTLALRDLQKWLQKQLEN